MGLFSAIGRALDARLSVAKWAHSMHERYGWHDGAAADFVAIRYQLEPKKAGTAQSILSVKHGQSPDIFDLAHAVADLELLSHYNAFELITTGVQAKTYGVIDGELIRLGHKPRT
jgi:hypothetical protein